MKIKKRIRSVVNILCLAIALFLASCTDGYKDDITFTSDVKNTQLESPDPSGVKFTPSSDGATVTIEWPVVHGAGGYQFSLYIVDDPENPILVGEENQFVDGCNTTRDLLEDTKYKAVIKALGNKEYNNAEALTASEAEHSTLVKVYATIPSGTDLGSYFAANPVKPLEEGETEIAYELEAGGIYTMTSNIALDTTTMTIRGDKINHAKIKMSTGSFISDGVGLKFKFIDFDCSEFENDAVLIYNKVQNPGKVSNSWVTVTQPVSFQSCNVTGLKKKLIWDSKTKYGLQTLLIKDCVIGQSNSVQLIHVEAGFVKDLSLTASTFYSDTESYSNKYFIQYNNTRINGNSEWAKEPYLWLTAGVAINNCTFYQVVKAGEMANYSGLAQKGNYLTITNSIFVDSGNKNVIRRFGGGGGNFTRTFGYNTYWFNGAFADSELTSNPKDDSGTHMTSDPKLKDPANADFTVGGSAQIAARTGDPRWLPAQ